jgi:hypothetical protein
MRKPAGMIREPAVSIKKWSFCEENVSKLSEPERPYVM